MTLFKQLALLISFLLLLILSVVLALNFNATTASLQERLYEDAKNTATSLSLTLGTAHGDVSVMETMINANFDSGHYESITLYDMQGGVIYERIKESESIDVPAVFMRFVSITIPSASANVSSGWSLIGVVKVKSDSSYAYMSLYNIFKDLLLSFALILAVGLLLLNAVIHAILKPLKEIRKQAEAILENEFILQEDTPYTLEFKDVINGMNAMVHRVEDIFNNANEAARRNKELLYYDSVTKLFNRRYFMLNIEQIVKEENRIEGGSIIFISLQGAEIINKLLGRVHADSLLLDFATYMQESTKVYDNSIVARMNGMEFATIIGGCEMQAAQHIANAISVWFKRRLKESDLEHEKEIRLSLGVYRYHQNEPISEILTQADSALTEAKALDNGHIQSRASSHSQLAMGKEQWREILLKAMDERQFYAIYRDVKQLHTGEVSHKVMSFAFNAGDKTYHYGEFIAHAIDLTLIDDIYTLMLETLFLTDGVCSQNEVVSIRLASAILEDVTTLEVFRKLFEHFSLHQQCRVVFEIADSFVINHFEMSRNYAALFREFGFGFGINNFSASSDDFNYLKALRVEFIKADCSFLLDHLDTPNAALHVVAEAIGANIIATYVKNEDEAKWLQTLGIKEIQGPYCDEL